MSWLLAAPTREYERLDALQHSHDTEYDGTVYTTPSLIDHDDGKENDGEEAQRATVRAPRT